MKNFFRISAILLLLSACDGASDNPTHVTPPANVGGGMQCPEIARICSDGSLGTRIQGSCEQSCPNDPIRPPADRAPPIANAPLPPATIAPPLGAPGGDKCTQEARICKDGSLGTPVPGSCEQKCPGE